jgi:putative Mn2+ efflux pump MntP
MEPVIISGLGIIIILQGFNLKKKKKKKEKKTTHKFTIFLATIIPIENGSTQVFNLLNYYLLIFK